MGTQIRKELSKETQVQSSESVKSLRDSVESLLLTETKNRVSPANSPVLSDKPDCEAGGRIDCGGTGSQSDILMASQFGHGSLEEDFVFCSSATSSSALAVESVQQQAGESA
ncbi:unnamed protein product [Pleuronectes platessa]|uniref:Uncharacterized protein n=1 Tax=Pleuronectes platessa TaxID=8262 RepID=A0A9N7VN61_PLEPL|nr:unnamed protein product [Pleuronectes platessa]